MIRHGNDAGDAGSLDGTGLRIGIVMSRWNAEVGGGMLERCRAELAQLGVREADVSLYSVPGALEIPLALQKLASTGRYDALVALGCVIRGETYHFELVANESGSGVTQVQLDSGVPVANGILTTENQEQALARMPDKGTDCARVAVEMALLLRRIDREHR